jgi:DNA-binding transcriptional ArsR family regulator
MYTRRDVFQAIADPVRRDIISMVAKEPMNLNTVADRFDISRPAVSKHMKILVECGMVVINQKGRERYCEAKLDSLNEVSDWVTEQRKIWTDRFDNLEIYLKQLQTKSKHNGKSKK